MPGRCGRPPTGLRLTGGGPPLALPPGRLARSRPGPGLGVPGWLRAAPHRAAAHPGGPWAMAEPVRGG